MGPTEIYTAAHELHIFTTIGAVCCLAFKKNDIQYHSCIVKYMFFFIV